MNIEKTYIMLKPDAIERKLMGEIIARIEKKGYKISDMKMFEIDKETLRQHYAHIADRPFYPEIDEVERMRLMGALRQGSVLLSGGMRIVNLRKRELANSLFVFDHLANIVGYYDKTHLVPFGEYMPFREILQIDKIVPIPSLKESIFSFV